MVRVQWARLLHFVNTLWWHNFFVITLFSHDKKRNGSPYGLTGYFVIK
jgi:hypothetical protein